MWVALWTHPVVPPPNYFSLLSMGAGSSRLALGGLVSFRLAMKILPMLFQKKEEVAALMWISEYPKYPVYRLEVGL